MDFRRDTVKLQQSLEINVYRLWKKIWNFAADMIVYVENPKEQQQ